MKMPPDFGLVHKGIFTPVSFIVLISFLAISCVSSSIKYLQLSPVKSDSLVTAKDLYEQADSSIKAKAPLNAEDIVIIESEEVLAALSIYEFKDIFWLEIYVYNGGKEPFTINPSNILLLDRNRLALRRLEPDEAANIYQARVSGIPPYQYQPKYIYNVQSATSGYLYSSGYFTAQTQSTITQYEDPYSQAGYSLGYLIGAAIVANSNKKLMKMAGAIYSVGLVEDSIIPGKTGAIGGLFWLKPSTWIPPLILRFIDTDYEVSFLAKKNVSVK